MYANKEYSTVPGEKSTSLADKGALSVLKNDKYSGQECLTKEHGIQLTPRLWEKLLALVVIKIGSHSL